MSESSAPDTLLDLAPELLELILSYLEPLHLTRYGSTCRRAHDFIQPTNQLLWKQTFLHLFDHPKHAWTKLVPTARHANRLRESTWDWHHELVRRVSVFNLLLEQDKDEIAAQLQHIVTTLLDIQQTASRRCAVSLNLLYLKRLVDRARDFECIVHDFDRIVAPVSVAADILSHLDRPVTRSMLSRGAPTPDWASRFHISYGPTEREQESLRSKAAARAIVYDWGVTGPDADFGPFKKDGSGTINYQTVEAISSLMHRIFATSLKPYELNPTGFDLHVPYRQPSNPACPEDWAGVTGAWAGTYAFLDYRALVHYNFAHNMEHPLNLGNYEEACGDLMRLDLELDDSDEIKGDKRLQSDLPHCEDLPKLYFNGTSSRQGTERPSIVVRGVVCLAPGGREVRWRYIIRYAGADQWQLEGVQPSGIRSGGIYGLWSHVDHDEHGPMGPFYYAPAELCDFSFD